MSVKRIQRIFALTDVWMNPIPTPAAALKAKLWQRMASTAVVRFTSYPLHYALVLL